MSLHPAFHQALAPAMPPQSRVDAYVSALKRFDWQFEFSDDHGFWRRCRDQLEFLRREQRAIDPEGVLWLEHGDRAFLLLAKKP